MIRVLVWLVLGGMVYGNLAVAQTDPTVKNHLERLPDTLQELRDQTRYLSWDSYQLYSRTLRHHRTIRISDSGNVVISETGKLVDQPQFVEVIKTPQDQDKAEFALYNYATGLQLERYPEDASFPIEGAPDASKESLPTVCIWCHHEDRPFISVIPFTQSFQTSIDSARNRVGIRQALADPRPDTEENKERLEQLNRRMEKIFPGRYSDMRVWLKSLDVVPNH